MTKRPVAAETQRSSQTRKIAGAIALVAVVTSAVLTFGLSGATNAPFSIGTVAAGTAVVTRVGPHAFPTNTCVSSNPAGALLSASAIPNMSQGTAITAQGKIPLVPSGFGIQVNTGGSTPSIAADLSENLVSTTAPASAIQSASSFNLDNPNTITSFSEGVSGFASTTLEANYFAEGAAPSTLPESMVNGHLTNEQVWSTTDSTQFPTPNEVVVTSLPGTDTPGQVEITIESGSTVIGLTFEGGSSLSLADVLAYAQQALAQLTETCASLDIMK